MPRPKDPTLQEQLRQWVKKYPDRTKYEDIAVGAGVSAATVSRYYPLVVARVANILPSEVKAKREEHFGGSPRRQKLSDEEIAEIQNFTMTDTVVWILPL
jgi:hypothetical protein